MSDFINTIDVLGDDVVSTSIVMKTVTELKDNVITSVGTYAFYRCGELVSITLPSVVSVGDNSFYLCSKLNSIDLASVKTIGNSAIAGCSSLKQLIIRSDTVCSIDYNNFMSGGITSANGYVYVPRDLVESYKTANNWNSIPNRFRALEDYTVDGTITGELDYAKI